MKRLNLLVDMDGVLEDLSEQWVAILNKRYGTQVRFEDLTAWQIEQSYPTLSVEQVYAIEFDEELYHRIRPQEGAVEYLKRLIDDGHTVRIVTEMAEEA